MSGPWHPPAPSLASLPVDRSKTDPKPAYYKLQFGDDVTGFSYYVRTLSVVIGRNCERVLPLASPAPPLAAFGCDVPFGFGIATLEGDGIGPTPPPIAHETPPTVPHAPHSLSADLAELGVGSDFGGDFELDPEEVAALATLEGPPTTVVQPLDSGVSAGGQEEIKADVDMRDPSSPSPAAKVASATGSPMVLSASGTPAVVSSVADKSATGSPMNVTPAAATPAADGGDGSASSAVQVKAESGTPPSSGVDAVDEAGILDGFPDIKPDLDALAGLDGFDLPPPPPPQPMKTEIRLEHVDVDLGPLKSVSRNHAKIEYRIDCGQFCLEIFGRNGAWVDDRYYVKGTVVPLNQGSQIQIATRIFSFVLPPSPDGSPGGYDLEGAYPYEQLPYPYNLPPEEVGYAEFYGEPGPGPASAAAMAARAPSIPAFNAFAASDTYGVADSNRFADHEWVDEWASGESGEEDSSEDGDDEEDDEEDEDEQPSRRRPVLKLRARRVQEESDLSSLSSEGEPEPDQRPVKKGSKKKSDKNVDEAAKDPPTGKASKAPAKNVKVVGKGFKSPALAMKQPGKKPSSKVKIEDAMDVDDTGPSSAEVEAQTTPSKKKKGDKKSVVDVKVEAEDRADKPKKESKKKKSSAPGSTAAPPLAIPTPTAPTAPVPVRPPPPPTLAAAAPPPTLAAASAAQPGQVVRPPPPAAAGMAHPRPPPGHPGQPVRPGMPGQTMPVRPPVRPGLALPPGAVARPPGQPGMVVRPQPGQPMARPPHPGMQPGMMRPPMPGQVPGQVPGQPGQMVRPGMAQPPGVRPPMARPPPPRPPPPPAAPAEPPRPYYISELIVNPTRPGHILCSVPIPPSGAGPRNPPSQILGLDGKPFIGPAPLKPTATFATIIHRALTNLPRGRGTLGEVCNWVAGEWEWFRLNPEAGWQNSIRHNLSLNKAFLKVPRIPEDDPESKGSVWILDPEEGPLFEEKQRRDALKNEGKAKNAEEKRMRERMKAEERARKQREREIQMAEARGMMRPGMGMGQQAVRPVRPPVVSANRGVLAPKAKIVVQISPITPVLRAKSVIDKTDGSGAPLPFVCDGTTLVLDQQTFGHLTTDIIDKLQLLGAGGAVDVLSAWVVNKNKQAAQKAAAAKAAGPKPGPVRPPPAVARPPVATQAGTPARPPAAAPKPTGTGKPLPGPAPPGANLTKVISMIAEVANARGDVNTVGPNASALLRYIRVVGVDIDLRVAERIWATGVVPPLPPKKANGAKPAVRPPAPAGGAVRPPNGPSAVRPPPANGAPGAQAVRPNGAMPSATAPQGSPAVRPPAPAASTAPATSAPAPPPAGATPGTPAPPRPAGAVPTPAPAAAPAAPPAAPTTTAAAAPGAGLKRKLEDGVPNGSGPAPAPAPQAAADQQAKRPKLEGAA